MKPKRQTRLARRAHRRAYGLPEPTRPPPPPFLRDLDEVFDRTYDQTYPELCVRDLSPIFLPKVRPWYVRLWRRLTR